LAGRYNFNTIKIYDQEGKDKGSVDTNGDATIYFLTEEDRNIASATRVSRQFYLYLSPTDTNTITVDFVKNVDDCGYDVIANTAFKYNDSLYTNAPCCHKIDFYK
jgi:hypothetical protein